MAKARRQSSLIPAMAGLCLAACAMLPASAHGRHHHHHVYAAPALQPMAAAENSGFGPTSPGVSSILIDARSGATLAADGADVPRYPASLTKLMTLDLAFQALSQGRMTLDTEIPVSYHAVSVEPVKLGLAPAGVIPVRVAILAMTTMSANDAATALGEYIGGGSEARCAGMMTLRAHALGMAQTRFYNASGLPDARQVTTARDLAILARDIVVTYPQYQSFFEVTSFNYEGHEVFSNNRMLQSYAGATGMKTGYTDLARHNLITSAERNGRELIGVELHEPSWGDSYMQMTALLDNGFGGHVLAPQTQIATQAQPEMPVAMPPPVERVALRESLPGRLHGGLGGVVQGNWVAQLGIYARMAKARTEALAVRQMRGVGVARIARVEHHGRTLWTAQLAGLSFDAAHQTCNVLAARGTSCRVLPPGVDHLAMLGSASGT